MPFYAFIYDKTTLAACHMEARKVTLTFTAVGAGRCFVLKGATNATQIFARQGNHPGGLRSLHQQRGHCREAAKSFNLLPRCSLAQHLSPLRHC
jgi:hypothetical protein